MKCSNQFIILAESKVAGVIGFVHYRFCWFKPKFDRPGINADALQGTGGTAAVNPKGLKTMAERIFLIENVFSNEVSESSFDSVTNLVLVSLAIQHARRFALYGVMDTAKTLVPFFKTIPV